MNKIQPSTSSVQRYAQSRSKNYNLGIDETPDDNSSDTSRPSISQRERIRLAEQALSVYVDLYA